MDEKFVAHPRWLAGRRVPLRCAGEAFPTYSRVYSLGTVRLRHPQRILLYRLILSVDPAWRLIFDAIHNLSMVRPTMVY